MEICLCKDDCAVKTTVLSGMVGVIIDEYFGRFLCFIYGPKGRFVQAPMDWVVVSCTSDSWIWNNTFHYYRELRAESKEKALEIVRMEWRNYLS